MLCCSQFKCKIKPNDFINLNRANIRICYWFNHNAVVEFQTKTEIREVNYKDVYLDIDGYITPFRTFLPTYRQLGCTYKINVRKK